MSEGVEIRMLSASDLDAVHRLETVSFPAPWRREFFDSELHASGRYNLVARKDGAVIGYLFSMWLFDEMHVNKIAVDESMRRRGIAAALMARCTDFAKSHGVKTISLEVRESNVGAQEFYKHLEFHSSYRRAKYYPDGEAAVVMTKSLVVSSG